MALCTLDPASGKSRRITKDTGYGYPTRSLDGRVMAFTHEGRVWVSDGRARNRREVRVAEGGNLEDPSLRPDGRALLADRSSSGPCIVTLATMRAKCRQSEKWMLWGTSRWLFGRNFAEDPWGLSLCKASVSNEKDCSGPVIFTGDPGTYYVLTSTAVSPDGKLIAVEEEPPQGNSGESRIVVFDTRTLKRVRTLTTGHYDSDARWSPDGRNILFTRDHLVANPGYVWELWRVAARGGKARRLTKGGTVFPVQTAWGG